MNWFVLFVESGKEFFVHRWISDNFDRQQLYSLVPQRQLVEKRQGKSYQVVKKLFPGYVFVKTKMDINKYYDLKSIPRVIKILGEGFNCAKVLEEEIEIILKLIGESNTIGFSNILKENSKIIVKDGPLLGLEGIIKKINKRQNRAKIAISLMGEPRLIDVGVEVLSICD